MKTWWWWQNGRLLPCFTNLNQAAAHKSAEYQVIGWLCCPCLMILWPAGTFNSSPPPLFDQGKSCQLKYCSALWLHANFRKRALVKNRKHIGSPMWSPICTECRQRLTKYERQGTWQLENTRRSVLLLVHATHWSHVKKVFLNKYPQTVSMGPSWR